MTKLVGILNVTPDSFSDGGRFLAADEAVAEAVRLIDAGADVLDIGAESTRPGSEAVPPEDEWRRLEPVLQKAIPYGKERGVAVSLDTRHAETARRGLALGADWINDVGGFHDEAMIEAVADSGCRIVLMHSLGIPPSKNRLLPDGCDPLQRLHEFARHKIAVLGEAGVANDRIIFDPGIGFGKSAAQSWQILVRWRELASLGLPILIGHSRKSFLRMAGAESPEQRNAATVTASFFLMKQRMNYLRVHDVGSHATVRRLLER